MNGNPVYLPDPWPRDALGSQILGAVGFLLLMFGVYRAVLFLEIMMGGW